MYKIIRGDSKKFKFQRKNSDGVITEKAEKVYFTVKENDKNGNNNVLIQKTIDDMEYDENYFYHFTLDPADTDDLEFKRYYFDIEIITGNYKKTPYKGILEVCSEITTKNDEV